MSWWGEGGGGQSNAQPASPSGAVRAYSAAALPWVEGPQCGADGDMGSDTMHAGILAVMVVSGIPLSMAHSIMMGK